MADEFPIDELPLAAAVAADKAAAATSATTVAAARKLFGKVKAGHAGTLDPMATGLLPILLGEATAFCRFLPDSKTYQADIRFGETTDTDDADGEVILRRPPPADLAAAVADILPSFVGDIEQTAPTFSALKHRGKPMHFYARAGIAVPEKRRRVKTESLHLVAVDDKCVRLTVVCGGGFYVRSLARDLGEQLQCGGHLCALRRIACSGMQIADAVEIKSLSAMDCAARIRFATPIEKLLSHLPAREIGEQQARQLGQGLQIAAMEEAGDGDSLERLFVGERFAGVGFLEKGMRRGEKMLSWTRSNQGAKE